MLIVDDIIRLTGNTVTASAQTAAMPDDNLRTLAMSSRWRTTSITDTPHVGAILSANNRPVLYDTVALLGYDGGPSRQLLRSTTLPDLTGPGIWAHAASLSVQQQQAHDVNSPTELTFYPWGLQASSSGVVWIDQAGIEKVGKSADVTGAEALEMRASAVVRWNNASDDIDLRIIAYSTLTTQQTEVDFDMSAGTAGTATDAGSFVGGTASMVALSDGWYLCQFPFTTDTADTISVRWQLLTGAGSTTIPSGESLIWGAPALSLAEASTATAEHILPHAEDPGPCFRARVGVNSTLASTEVDSLRTDWKHAASRNRMRNFSRFGFYHHYSQDIGYEYVQVDLYDPYNANSYIEAGRLVLGKAIDLSARFARGFALGAEELTTEREMDGGQIYRMQRPIRRRQRIRVHYVSQADAMDGLFLLQRTVGRSIPVLVIASETDTLYQQDQMIYGFIDELTDISSDGKHFWHWDFTIREAL